MMIDKIKLGLDLDIVLDKGLCDVESLVDQAQLMNLVKSQDDPQRIGFDAVRRISILEQFLGEHKTGN